MTMEHPPPPVSEVVDAFVHTHRVLSVTQGYEDGSASVRLWYVEIADAENLIAMLGPAQESSFIPAQTVETLCEINEGLPTLGSDFFA